VVGVLLAILSKQTSLLFISSILPCFLYVLIKIAEFDVIRFIHLLLYPPHLYCQLLERRAMINVYFTQYPVNI
jgi:hypothetical protein